MMTNLFFVPRVLWRAQRPSFRHIHFMLGAGITFVSTSLFASGDNGMGVQEPYPSLPQYGSHGTHLGKHQSDFGGVGLMQNPTARMAAAGQFSFNYNRAEPYRRYSISLQPLDWFEFSFRYSEITDRLYGESIAGNRDYLDKGFDAKFRLWQESRYLPEVALGLRDAGGTTLFGAEYLVANKRWYDLDFSLGLGWGYLGARGDFGSPLSLVGERFDSREGETGIDSTGDFDLNQLFSGNTALFAGVEYQTPWQPLVLQLEYEGNDYSSEPATSSIEQESPFNIGARFHLSDSVTLNAGWQRGNTLMTGISLSTNLANISQAKRDTMPFEVEGSSTAGPPAGDTTNEAGTSSATDASPTTPDTDWAEAIDSLAQNAGVKVNRISTDGDTLLVEATPTKYRSMAKTAGRANRILHRYAPAHITTFRYRWQARGMDLRDDVHSRTDFVAAAQSASDEPQYHYSVYSQSSRQRGLYDEVLYEPKETPLSYSIGPGYNQNLGGPDGYLYQLQLQANAELRTDTNGWFSGSLGWTVLDNFDQFDYVADSELPRVRTFIGEYLKEASLGITNLQYTRTTQLSKNWYAMGYGGLLEMMYAGLGSEVLYRPFNSDWAVGADVNYVRQREFDQQFSLRDYSTTTGHLNAYWQTGYEDILAKVSVGRYLAKDIGATFDFSREFASGARMGAWATFTDAGDKFGEGSFDKGVYISLPLDAFFTTYSRDRVNIAWQPLTRDGGARLGRRYTLYDLTGERSLGEFFQERDAVWK
ncbi:YjbH domain-containing protein [Halomonas salinarum]|uniref:YjbH domain-containing protein n=1 Tax=Halomonas salinarum TaxID=1158993 RepID=UPI001FD85644|nr:YjbH domain-containing protein [Halomonas salinarum]